MADLENLLLQAAGRTATSGGRKAQSQNPSWRRDGSYSAGSDSKSDSDDDSDEDPLFSNKRNQYAPQVPLKKRFDKAGGAADDEQFSGDQNSDSDSAPSVGSDLYKGESDKEELEKLPELQRELILAERGTKIDDYKLRQKARASSSSKVEKKAAAAAATRKESSPPSVQFRSRTSARTETKAAAKNEALDELRRKRMKQQDPEGYHRSRDAAGARDSSPAKHRAAPVDESSSESGESEEDGNKSDIGDDGFPMDLAIGDNLNDESVKFEDIKDITVRRARLAKWFTEPFFEELIAGCFVRLGVGRTRSGKSTYKLCLVKNVDATEKGRQYKLEGRTTYKYLNLVWGAESSAARWQMDMVSDSPPLVEEFELWVQEVERTGGRMPTRQDILDKKEAIQKISNYVYSAATVKQMLREKKSISSRPLNAAAEKDRLRKEMEMAESLGDEAEMDRIRVRLKELDDLYQQAKGKDLKAVRLAEMNKRNRAENFKNASEVKPVNTSLKAGEAGYDPFSRRWTRSINYYLSKPGGEANGAAAADNNAAVEVGSGETNGVETVVGVEVGLATTAAALEAAEDAGKLVDTRAPVDLGTESNSLHNFELQISLAGLQKFGGPTGAVAGYLAKKQKTEATIGYRVPENDGRRHAVTLTISDYKRRMGLI